MSDLALDQTSNNDLLLTSGDLSTVILDAAIRQNLLQRLQLFLGEWFLDTTSGVPYYQTILVKNPNLDVVQATLKDVILSTNGIESLNSFKFEYDNSLRTLTVAFEAKSTNGTVINVQTQVGGGI